MFPRLKIVGERLNSASYAIAMAKVYLFLHFLGKFSQIF